MTPILGIITDHFPFYADLLPNLTIDNKPVYYWSYRHLWAALDNLLSLFTSGALKEKKDGEIMKVVNEIITKKGKVFRNEVADWLKENTNLQVISYEVTMEPYGIIHTEKNLGDIDIFAIDHTSKIIYAIECKNTVDSRAVHEMKTEIDKYLGRDGNTGLVQKHVARDLWLKANSSKLNHLVRNSHSYSINSLILTAAEIPLAYLKENELPLPLISFHRLLMTNGNALKELFEK